MKKPLSMKGVVQLRQQLEMKESAFADEEKRLLALKSLITKEDGDS